MYPAYFAFDQKNHESYKCPGLGCIGIFVQPRKIEARAGAYVSSILCIWSKKSWKLKLSWPRCGRDFCPVPKNRGACRCPWDNQSWHLIKKILKFEIGVASDVSGLLSRPEKSRHVQVPMRQPKLAFDEKTHEIWNWRGLGAIGIFVQSRKIEARAGAQVSTKVGISSTHIRWYTYVRRCT